MSRRHPTDRKMRREWDSNSDVYKGIVESIIIGTDPPQRYANGQYALFGETYYEIWYIDKGMPPEGRATKRTRFRATNMVAGVLPAIPQVGDWLLATIGLASITSRGRHSRSCCLSSTSAC